MSQSTQSLWMVRSQGKIIGPVEIAQLLDLVHTREITVLDEILAPGTRWKTIRNVPEVYNRVQQNHKSQSSDQNTRTHTLTSRTQTHSQTEEMFESTVVGRIMPREVQTSPILREVKEVKSQSQPTTPSAKSYGYSHDPYIGKKASSLAGQLFWMVVLVGLTVAGYSIYSNKSKSAMGGSVKKMTYEAWVQQGVQLKRVGEWAEAQKSFQQALQLKPQAFEASLHLAEIIVQDRTQTVLARRLLNELLATHFDDQTLSVVHTALGTLALYESQLKEAEEHLELALKHDSERVETLFNRGMVYFLRKEFTEAQKVFVRLTQKNLHVAYIMLAHCWSQIADQKPQQKEELVRRARQSLSSLTNGGGDYSFESQFLDLVLILKMNQGDFDKGLSQLLAMDSGLTQRHVHPPMLYVDLLKWDYSLIACHDLSLKTASDAVKYSILALCYEQSQQYAKAQSYFDQALKAGGIETAMPHQLQALWRRRDEKVLALIKEMASQKLMSRQPLVQYLNGLMAIKNKQKAELESALQVLSQHPLYSIQLQELRLSYLQLFGSAKEFSDLLKNQLEVNPSYRPFLLMTP